MTNPVFFIHLLLLQCPCGRCGPDRVRWWSSKYTRCSTSSSNVDRLRSSSRSRIFLIEFPSAKSGDRTRGNPIVHGSHPRNESGRCWPRWNARSRESRFVLHGAQRFDHRWSSSSLVEQWKRIASRDGQPSLPESLKCYQSLNPAFRLSDEEISQAFGSTARSDESKIGKNTMVACCCRTTRRRILCTVIVTGAIIAITLAITLVAILSKQTSTHHSSRSSSFLSSTSESFEQLRSIHWFYHRWWTIHFEFSNRIIDFIQELWKRILYSGTLRWLD